MINQMKNRWILNGFSGFFVENVFQRGWVLSGKGYKRSNNEKGDSNHGIGVRIICIDDR